VTCRSDLVLPVAAGFLGEGIILLGNDFLPMKRVKKEMFSVIIAQRDVTRSKAAAGDLIIAAA
jgi:hypothetical protein